MLWRGLITESDYREVLKYYAYPEAYWDKILELTVRLPGIDDVIRFAVKEAFVRPELDVEYPAELTLYGKMLGFSEEILRYFWRAHWVLVPLTQLYEMYHRGIIDEDTLRTQLRYHDYTPEWRDKLMAISWDLPGRIDLRWAYEWGVIDEEELKQWLIKTGIGPEYVDVVVKAWIANLMREEIMGLVREAIEDRAEGWIDDEEFRARLRDLGLPEERIEYYLMRAVSKAEREFREAQLDILEEALKLGLITEDQFRSQAREIGLTDWRIEYIITITEMRKRAELPA